MHSRPSDDLGNMRELGVRSIAVTCKLLLSAMAAGAMPR